MARPRPEPPSLPRSSWTKSPEVAVRCASGTPGPVSRTSIRTVTSPLASAGPGDQAAISTAPPARVNFTALDSRLSIIWRVRVWSISAACGSVAATSRVSPTRFSSAAGCTMVRHSRSRPGRSTWASRSSSCPASTFARSRMSLATATRWRPAASSVSARLRCSPDGRDRGPAPAPGRARRSAACAAWLMRARKRDFALVAAAAVSLAIDSSRIACFKAVMSVRMPTVPPSGVDRSVISSQRPSGSSRSIGGWLPRCQVTVSRVNPSRSSPACGYWPRFGHLPG